MTIDFDTLCHSLQSPAAWGCEAAMPETREHFKKVAAGSPVILPSVSTAPPAASQRVLDMARCASEVHL